MDDCDWKRSSQMLQDRRDQQLSMTIDSLRKNCEEKYGV